MPSTITPKKPLNKLQPSKVYIPYYCCDSLIEPLLSEQIDYSFYPISARFEIEEELVLQENEFVLFINYFGLKEDIVSKYINTYNDRLIIDNTHAYFKRSYQSNYSFNSARKWFGVPDGAFLYSPLPLQANYDPNTAIQTDHLQNRKQGLQELAFEQYQTYERGLTDHIMAISGFSEKLLNKVDYEAVAAQRRNNFEFYHEHLNSLNQLDLNEINEQVPFCYPLWSQADIPRNTLYDKGIFFPTLWPELLDRAADFELEKQMCRELLPLPLDHRYGTAELMRVIKVIKEISLSN